MRFYKSCSTENPTGEDVIFEKKGSEKNNDEADTAGSSSGDKADEANGTRAKTPPTGVDGLNLEIMKMSSNKKSSKIKTQEQLDREALLSAGLMDLQRANRDLEKGINKLGDKNSKLTQFVEESKAMIAKMHDTSAVDKDMELLANFRGTNNCNSGGMGKKNLLLSGGKNRRNSM